MIFNYIKLNKDTICITTLFQYSTSTQNVLNSTVDLISNDVSTKHRQVDDSAVQQAVEDVAAVAHRQETIRISHSMTHQMSHDEPVSIDKT